MKDVKELTTLNSVAEYISGWERNDSHLDTNLNDAEKLIVKIAVERSLEPDKDTVKILDECSLQLAFFVRHLREVKEELKSL